MQANWPRAKRRGVGAWCCLENSRQDCKHHLEIISFISLPRTVLDACNCKRISIIHGQGGGSNQLVFVVGWTAPELVRCHPIHPIHPIHQTEPLHLIPEHCFHSIPFHSLQPRGSNPRHLCSISVAASSSSSCDLLDCNCNCNYNCDRK